MKVAVTVVAILIGLLSIAAGGAKVALLPEEVTFLDQFGFGNALIIIFGIAQILAGLLLLIPVTRLFGSVLAGIAFALSSVLLFASGNTTFGSVSLLPVMLAGLVTVHTLMIRPRAEPGAPKM